MQWYSLLLELGEEVSRKVWLWITGIEMHERHWDYFKPRPSGLSVLADDDAALLMIHNPNVVLVSTSILKKKFVMGGTFGPTA